MNENLKNRLRNKGLWLAVASLVLLVLQQFGVQVVPDQYNEIVNALLGVLVLAGVLSDPTTYNGGFGDDK